MQFGTGETSNLGDLFPSDRNPDEPWLIEVARDGTQRTYSYGALRHQADALALGLRAAGHAPGTRISIVAENSARYLITYFAIMRAGFCAVPVNFKLPDTAIAHIHRDAEVALAFADEAQWARVPEGVPKIRLDTEAWAALHVQGKLDIAAPTPEDLANILYTSGSTGMPKGVPLMLICIEN